MYEQVYFYILDLESCRHFETNIVNSEGLEIICML